MGSALSFCANNTCICSNDDKQLSFHFHDYILDRQELAGKFRDLAQSAAELRQRKGTLQVINGASGVTAGIAGGVAIVAAVSSPLAAAVAVATVVSNSITAASLTSSVASYCHGHAGDKEILQRMQNLEYLITTIQKKDQEVNQVLKNLPVEKENTVVNIEACQQLESTCKTHLDTSKDKPKIVYDLPLSVLKSQGIILGTKSIVDGAKQVQQVDELEKALTDTADVLEKETAAILALEQHFRHQFVYLCCIPSVRIIPSTRGHLSYIDGRGSGCWHTITMVAAFVDPHQQKVTLRSDGTSNVIKLPEGATSVKVHFELQGNSGGGGTEITKVDRSNPNQPWVKNDRGEYQTDMFDFDCGDGVDAVFVVKRTLAQHSFVEKAWDFGRSTHRPPRSWEWWENANIEGPKLLPDLEHRLQNNSSGSSSLDHGSCGIDDFACGSCFGSSSNLAVVAVA